MTTYWISLNWQDKNEHKSSLEYNWIIYTVYWQGYWTNMYVVEIEWQYFNNACGIYLTYMADEFGWYGVESMDKAKRAVESYLTNVLHYDFNS